MTDSTDTKPKRVRKADVLDQVRGVSRGTSTVVYWLQKAGQRRWYDGRRDVTTERGSFSEAQYRPVSPEERIDALRQAETWAATVEERAFRARQLVRAYRRQIERERAEALQRIGGDE